MATQIITEPADEPITTAEQKSHSRIDIATEDTLIAGFVKAARTNLEDLTGIKFLTQKWLLTLPAFPSTNIIKLPFSPIISVDEIKTIDADGDEAVFNTDNYVTDFVSIPAIIKLKSGYTWDEPTSGYREVNGVEIFFTTGYATTAKIPVNLKLAIKMLAAHFYENREATTIGNLSDLPMGVASLVMPYKTWQREL